MRLVDANPHANVRGLDELPGKSNYFIGTDPKKWRTNVPTYAKVKYQGVFPGVDLVYHGSHRQLEYDFVVQPGGDPRSIQLAIISDEQVSSGQKAVGSETRAHKSELYHQSAIEIRKSSIPVPLHVDSNGDLVVGTEAGQLIFRKPVVYQPTTDHGERTTDVVSGKYALKGNRITFQVASYDRNRPLIIDPILSYSTYLGGTNIDSGNGIAVAPDGSAFIAGITFSADFPTVHPVHSSGHAFVSKISADGSTLLYSTYLGGSNQDGANGIAVDSLGNAYVTGFTDSLDFPVTPGVFATECGADGHCGSTWNFELLTVFNAFVTELNAAGSAIVHSSFLGNYSSVQGTAIAVGGDENVYVTGTGGAPLTPNVPVVPPRVPPLPFCTANGYQIAPGGATDAFVAKIDASFSAILYCSYLGGDSEEDGYGIAVDSSANAYVTGLTYSTNLPVTASALQRSYSGAGDAFFAKFNTDAAGVASLVYSTYVGGNGLDQANAVAVDAAGNAYITGLSKSRLSTLGFKPPAGAFQSDCKLDAQSVCEGDAFVAKIDPGSTGAASLIYFTYLGGTLADSGSGIALDTSDNAYVTGSTVSSDFPVVGSVPQTTFGGGNADAFVTELDPAAATLVYSSYLGGTNTDTGAGIAVDTGSPASAYVTGQTCSLDFPLANAVQTSGIGNCDAFVSKVSVLVGIALNPAGLVFPTQNVGTASQPQSVTLTNGNAKLSITSIVVTGPNADDFSETNTCGTSVPVGAQCTITVTFKPKTAGVRKAYVTITDSAPGSPHKIPLTGSTSIVGLSASSLAFGNQPVGVTSSVKTVRVTNNGTATLTMSGIVASGDFSQTNNCSVPLQPTANCVISVTYTPSVPGQSVGALTIADNAAGSPQVVLLTGNGVLQPVVTLSTTSLTFANQAIGTTSAVQQFTAGNTGSAPLNISSITATGDFTQTNTCGSSLAVKANCTISVTFTPSAAGPRTGSLTLTDNAADSPQVVSLGGAGADFALSVSPASNSVVAGNEVSYTLTVTPSFGFNAKVTLGCGGAIPRGATCSVSRSTVTPDGTNPVTATVTVTTATRSLAPPGLRPRGNRPSFSGQVGPLWCLAGLVSMVLAGLAFGRRRRVLLGLAFVMGLVLFWAGCGSGGTPVDVPTGTPAGSYTLTLSGTSGTVTHNATANLTVM
jgi:hypothetical protein